MDIKRQDKGMKVVGIMSGTSLDGIDYVLTHITNKEIKFLDLHSCTLNSSLKKELSDAAEGNISFRESQHLHFKLGKYYYLKLKEAVDKKNWNFDLIGLHGQTLYHFPPLGTCQMGEPSFLTKFNVPVVSDFRSKLLTHKSDGAPLAPVLHNRLMSGKEWAFINIGGMGNISYKDKNGELFATDLGPGNVFIDACMKQLFNKNYDKNGKTASQGLPDLDFVDAYYKGQPFFHKKNPKTCGREEFSESETKKILFQLSHLRKEDIIATVSEITIKSIRDYLKRHKAQNIVISGGGAKNNYLLKRIKEDNSPAKVSSSMDLGWPVEAIEGAAFALLAYEKVNNIKNQLSFLKAEPLSGPLGRID